MFLHCKFTFGAVLKLIFLFVVLLWYYYGITKVLLWYYFNQLVSMSYSSVIFMSYFTYSSGKENDADKSESKRVVSGYTEERETLLQPAKTILPVWLFASVILLSQEKHSVCWQKQSVFRYKRMGRICRCWERAKSPETNKKMFGTLSLNVKLVC